VLLGFALRSVRFGFISLIPNLVPAAMGFGLWFFIDGQVGLALSVVAGMTLGIVVDDTVHFLSKYLRARRIKHQESEAAVRYAFASVGHALWITTLVLVAGFLVLAQSSFKLNADMGLLTAITILIALIIDFLFLPPLLMLFDKKKMAEAHTLTKGEVEYVTK
jgi:predicted RND superfamily exporter protein